MPPREALASPAATLQGRRPGIQTEPRRCHRRSSATADRPLRPPPPCRRRIWTRIAILPVDTRRSLFSVYSHEKPPWPRPHPSPDAAHVAPRRRRRPPPRGDPHAAATQLGVDPSAAAPWACRRQDCRRRATRIHAPRRLRSAWPLPQATNARRGEAPAASHRQPPRGALPRRLWLAAAGKGRRRRASGKGWRRRGG